MPSFYDYLIKSTREFKYRIRTIAPIDSIELDRIEYILAKYDVVSIDGPKKTIMQSRPLDFVHTPAAEIYIIDIVTHIPASNYILQQEIRHALNVPEQYVIVRSLNDPSELQMDAEVEQTEVELQAAENGLRPAPLLSSDPTYHDYETNIVDEPIAGNEYTKKFLKYLAKVKAERLEITPVIEPDKRRMFAYLEPPIDPEYYVEKPYVKPITVKPGTKVDPPANTSPYGNFDDSIKSVRRAYVNKDGDEVLITAKKLR